MVGADTEDLSIEGCVVESAECQAVRDDRLTPGVAVRNDVRRLEQLGVPQTANGTTVLVGLQHSLPEGRLMEASQRYGRHIRPPCLRDTRRGTPTLCQALARVHCDAEAEFVRIVTDDVDRPRGQILSLDHSKQVDERSSSLHRKAQAYVVAVSRIRSAIAVKEEPIVLEAIFVGPGPTLDLGSRRDAEWHLWESGRLEDALRANERHPLALEVEAARQHGPGEHLAEELGLLR